MSKNNVCSCRCNSEKNVYLECGEKVLFTGNYTIDKLFKGPGTVSFEMNVDVNENGKNYVIVEFYVIKKPASMLQESYYLTSYDEEKNNVGEIGFNGFYLNDTNSLITQAGFFTFNVNSSGGIYSDVSKIILDTNESTRKVYFVGK